jgi:hypothetical protein
MRGLAIGQRSLTAGVATIAVAGLITATPPAASQLDITVSHQAVALTAASDASLATVAGGIVTTIAGVTAAVVGGAAAAPILLVATGVTIVAAEVGLLDGLKDPAERLKRTLLETFPIDRIVDALPPELKEEGLVIARLLIAQRLGDLKNLDTTLARLQGLLDQRQKIADKQLSQAKVNLASALSVVGSLVGYSVPTEKVYSYFDQADTRVDHAYDGLEGRLQKLQEQIDKLIANPSPGAQTSARLAVSAIPSSKPSASSPTKTPTAARSARQAGKPAAANRSGKATKSPSSHARSQRAAK